MNITARKIITSKASKLHTWTAQPSLDEPLTEAAPAALQQPLTRVNAYLEDRILASIPVNELAYSKLLSLLAIEASTAIGTACVTLGRRSCLLVNPAFVDQHCQSDEALAMLVMHELMHILLGHTRLFERVTPLQNIAFDAVINAQLCLHHPAPVYTQLFRRLYDDTALPYALLRPPEGWGTPNVVWKLKNNALRLHKALYTQSSVTYLEIYRLLSQSDACTGEVGDVPLLGNHAGEAQGPCEPELLDEISEIVARWPMVERIAGRDDGGALRHQAIEPLTPRKQAVKLIRHSLAQLANIGPGYRGVPTPAPVEAATLQPFPTRHDRRAGVLALLGQQPIFYQDYATIQAVAYQERVHLYVDVSGSMWAELPLVYGALAPLAEFIHPQVHLFSTCIEDVAIQALKEGMVAGTGGTDITPVTGHMIKHKVRRAVFITDGYVGDVASSHQQQLANNGTRVNVILTNHGRADFAQALNGNVRRLPAL